MTDSRTRLREAFVNGKPDLPGASDRDIKIALYAYIDDAKAGGAAADQAILYVKGVAASAGWHQLAGEQDWRPVERPEGSGLDLIAMILTHYFRAY